MRTSQNDLTAISRTFVKTSPKNTDYIVLFLLVLLFRWPPLRSAKNRLTIVIDIVEGLRRVGSKNGQNSLWGGNKEKTRGPKMAKIQYGVKPDIFKHATCRSICRLSPSRQQSSGTGRFSWYFRSFSVRTTVRKALSVRDEFAARTRTRSGHT